MRNLFPNPKSSKRTGPYVKTTKNQYGQVYVKLVEAVGDAKRNQRLLATLGRTDEPRVLRIARSLADAVDGAFIHSAFIQTPIVPYKELAEHIRDLVKERWCQIIDAVTLAGELQKSGLRLPDDYVEELQQYVDANLPNEAYYYVNSLRKKGLLWGADTETLAYHITEPANEVLRQLVRSLWKSGQIRPLIGPKRYRTWLKWADDCKPPVSKFRGMGDELTEIVYSYLVYSSLEQRFGQ